MSTVPARRAGRRLVEFLLGIDGAMCQPCIEGGSALRRALVTLDLVTLGASGRLVARRGRCALCHAATVVFRLER